jgi:hypothetical protein
VNAEAYANQQTNPEQSHIEGIEIHDLKQMTLIVFNTRLSTLRESNQSYAELYLTGDRGQKAAVNMLCRRYLR